MEVIEVMSTKAFKVHLVKCCLFVKSCG